MKNNESRSTLMKRNSRSLVMRCVSRASRASRTQIAKETRLSRAHVVGVVDELVAEGELVETASVSAGRGRPTTLLEINHKSISVGGVWIAADSIELGVAGADGEILARQTLSYSGDPSNDLDAIAKAIRACAMRSGKSLETLRGVGVVVAGLVDPALGLICVGTFCAQGFAGMPIAKLLHERLGVPVYADTDIRAAAVADQWLSAKTERALYVQFGDGVGAALVIGGELSGGATGAAPLLGHLPLGPSKGFLEPHISTSAFLRNLWPDVDTRKLGPRQIQDMVRQGVDLVSQGDHDAVAAISKVAEYMGLGIAVGIGMLDPQKVYVTGTLIDFFPEMMAGIIRRESIPLVDRLFRGVDIQPLVGWRDFEFNGAFGLVLSSRHRAVNRDISAQLMNPWSSEDALGADGRYGPAAVHSK